MADITGTSGDDVLFGTGADDQVLAWDGDDHLYGSAGADRLNGMNGVDTVDYSLSAGPITVIDTGGSRGDAAGDDLYYIEIKIGSSFNDILVGTVPGNFSPDGANELEGGAGADPSSTGAAASTPPAILHSAAGVSASLATKAGFWRRRPGRYADRDLRMRGSALADTLVGDTGSNVLEGGAGADTFDGGAGLDTVSYAHSAAGVRVGLSSGVLQAATPRATPSTASKT